MATLVKGLGPVAPHVKAAAEEIATRFGITNIGGWRASGSVPDSDHPKGLAIDVMTVEKAQMVAEWALANAKRLGITYVIWNRRINDTRNGKGWVPYDGPNPHTDHVHISFFAKPGDPNAPNVNVEGSSPVDAMGGCWDALIKALNPF